MRVESVLSFVVFVVKMFRTLCPPPPLCTLALALSVFLSVPVGTRSSSPLIDVAFITS